MVEQENLNKEILDQLQKTTNENVQYVENLVSKTVSRYCEPLDDIMQKIYNDIVQNEQPPLCSLEKCLLELSNCIYFMSEKLEKLAIYDSISKQSYKEVYNNRYLDCSSITDSKKKPTVAEITATAENDCIYESITNEIYNKAYKILRNKVDAANTMLSCINKIISKRMMEMQLTATTPSGKQILNESSIDNSSKDSSGFFEVKYF